MHKEILVVSTYPTDASSYYRAFGPLSKLSSDGWHVKKPVGSVDWTDLVCCDAVFLHRPSEKDSLRVIKEAKKISKKIWIDYDDDLLNIPSFHPAKSYFEEQSNTIKDIIKEAELITVATPQLKKVYNEYSKNVKVIPNAYCSDFTGKIPNNSNIGNTLFWRGSATHLMDLASQIDAMTVLSQERDWKWKFVGDVEYIKMFIKNCQVISPVTITSYFDLIKKINPTLWVYPLISDVFNKSKSNIAWIEATASGGVVIGPNLPEWNRPGITNYSSKQEFIDKIDQLMNDNKMRENNFQKSKKYIESNLLLERTNQQRLNLLNQLVQ